ncbi:MAG TPA: bifunctional riboflavin kinase/FAD synthetase [Kofleriaceae bacterium]|nr:bifunctional riboflavin kinase/FAD synthetase [Kofleriaceae bacterium]
MEVIRGHQHAPARLGATSGAAVAIGNFDGVHVGHRALVERTRELAAAHGARSVVLTFDPHPAAVVGARAPAQLTTIDRRLELLAEAGIDAVCVEPFTKELASRAPHAFIDDVVIFALRARAIVVGYDFSYGHGRAGTTDALRSHGAHAGIEVDVLPAVQVDGVVASSSKIRSLLLAGDVPAAARLLGRRWDVDGVVIHGAKRGRTIGVPTANIATDGDLPLAPGIYAVTLATRSGAPLPAVASLGTNPTFVDGGGLVLEVHVLDWDGDLYDQRVRITFASRLREERKYETVDALIAQIRRDIDDARAVLAASEPRTTGHS